MPIQIKPFAFVQKLQLTTNFSDNICEFLNTPNAITFVYASTRPIEISFDGINKHGELPNSATLLVIPVNSFRTQKIAFRVPSGTADLYIIGG